MDCLYKTTNKIKANGMTVSHDEIDPECNQCYTFSIESISICSQQQSNGWFSQIDFTLCIQTDQEIQYSKCCTPYRLFLSYSFSTKFIRIHVHIQCIFVLSVHVIFDSFIRVMAFVFLFVFYYICNIGTSIKIHD